ncbi:MAG: DUF1294 domain-containing protein [Acutalibacteraceae bacterium]|jgi:uncharacterized membrane protein YsdA (DUF1294 family)
MPLWEYWALGYLAVISLTAIVLAVVDKRHAKKRRWRIPEAALFLIAAIGGAGAMFATMLLIRHKTRHARFMVGLPLLIVLHAGLIWWLIR